MKARHLEGPDTGTSDTRTHVLLGGGGVSDVQEGALLCHSLLCAEITAVVSHHIRLRRFVLVHFIRFGKKNLRSGKL